MFSVCIKLLNFHLIQLHRQRKNMIIGPFGINPLYFSLSLFGSLLLFVIYLLLPRGFRVSYCNGYPKRYVWSAKPRRRRNVSPCTCSRYNLIRFLLFNNNFLNQLFVAQSIFWDRDCIESIIWQ